MALIWLTLKSTDTENKQPFSTVLWNIAPNNDCQCNVMQYYFYFDVFMALMSFGLEIRKKERKQNYSINLVNLEYLLSDRIAWNCLDYAFYWALYKYRKPVKNIYFEYKMDTETYFWYTNICKQMKIQCVLRINKNAAHQYVLENQRVSVKRNVLQQMAQPSG